MSAFIQRSDIMAGISGYNSISTLFSGLSGNSSVTSGIYGSLSELASIRSGSYYKLAKKYYGMSSSSSDVSGTGVSDRVSRMDYDYKNGDYKINLQSTSTSGDSVSTIADTEKNAQNLKDSVAALTQKGTGSVFKRTGGEYDTDKIYDAVSSFVNDYNNMLSAASKSASTSVSNAASSMTTTTAVNSKLLSRIGITIGSDNKLAIDEDTFRNSDMSNVESLFNGSGSYGYQVGVNASMIYSAAQLEASKSNTYTVSGTYSYNFNVGSLFSQSV